MNTVVSRPLFEVPEVAYHLLKVLMIQNDIKEIVLDETECAALGAKLLLLSDVIGYKDGDNMTFRLEEDKPS